MQIIRHTPSQHGLVQHDAVFIVDIGQQASVMIVSLTIVFQADTLASDKICMMAGRLGSIGFTGFIFASDFRRVYADVADKTIIAQQQGVAVDDGFYPVPFAGLESCREKERNQGDCYDE